MMYDAHVHMVDGDIDAGLFFSRLDQAGLAGAVVISRKPPSLYHYPNPATSEQRLSDLLRLTEQRKELYPFYFLDPMEKDAVTQVEYAVRRGVAGFKVVCNKFYPGDEQAMTVFRHIAAYNKPILFHTGILYDGRNPSTRYNRPGEFDALFAIEGLRFCLAHISWPWCDECIALFGKFENSKGKYPLSKTQMYIDIAPGTPPSYRRDALQKLFQFEYSVKDYALFGTDGAVNRYDVEYTQFILNQDKAIFDALEVDAETREHLYWKNLKAFIGG